MTQGIREFTNKNFAALLPKVPEMGATKFRREVMDLAVIAFGISVASAATHYNHSLKTARATDPASVALLGRADDKKGGRKPVYTVDVIKVKTGEVVASGLSQGKAAAMIAAASLAHKAKLAIKAKEPATPEPAVVVAGAEAVTA